MSKQQDEAAKRDAKARQERDVEQQHAAKVPTPWGTPETNDAREEREEQQRRGDTPVVEGTQQQGVYGEDDFSKRPTPFMAPERERDTWELDDKGDVIDKEDAWDDDDDDDDGLHIEPPTLPSLEERLDEIEARLEQLESFEPVRGEQELPAIDHVHRKKVRAKRRAIREKQEAKKGLKGESVQDKKAREKREEKERQEKHEHEAEKEREERAAQ
jgi:hypothetical protein